MGGRIIGVLAMTLGIARELHPFSSLRLSIYRALLSTRVRDKADTHGLSLFYSTI